MHLSLKLVSFHSSRDTFSYCSTLQVMQSVRGQLEPPHISAKPGWRYLQCTDRPNECKVLLPPLTARLYEQLLVAELTAKQNALKEEGERLERLKEHVIKKCIKLRGKPSPLKSFVEIHARDNFRSGKLEAWAKEASSEGKKKGSLDAHTIGVSSAKEIANSGNSAGRLIRRLSSGVRTALRPSDANPSQAIESKSIRRKVSQSSQRDARKRSLESQANTENPKHHDRKPNHRPKSLLRKPSPSRPINQSQGADSKHFIIPEASHSATPQHLREISTPSAQPPPPSSRVNPREVVRKHGGRQSGSTQVYTATHNSEYYTLAGVTSSTISPTVPVDTKPPISPSVPKANGSPGQHPRQPVTPTAVPQPPIATSIPPTGKQSSEHHAAVGSRQTRSHTVPIYNPHSVDSPQAHQSHQASQLRDRRSNKQTLQVQTSPEIGQPSNRRSQQQSLYPYQPKTDPPPVMDAKSPPQTVRKRRSYTVPAPTDSQRRTSVDQPSPTPLSPEFYRWIEQQTALAAAHRSSQIRPGDVPQRVQLPVHQDYAGTVPPPSAVLPQPLYSAGPLHRQEAYEGSDLSRSSSPDSHYWHGGDVDPITPEASQHSLPLSMGSKTSDPIIPDEAYLEIADLHQRHLREREPSKRLSYYPDTSSEKLENLKAGVANALTTTSTTNGILRKPSRGILVTGNSRPASRNSNRSVSFALSPHQDARAHVRDCEAEQREALEEVQRSEIWRKHRPGDPDVERRYLRALDAITEANARLRAAEEEYHQRYKRNEDTDDDEPYFKTEYV